VQHEECVLSEPSRCRAIFVSAFPERPRLRPSLPPDAPADFHPVRDALARMAFTARIPTHQGPATPDAGDLLARDGANLASSWIAWPSASRKPDPELRTTFPKSCRVRGVEVSHVGPRETLEFRQTFRSREPWRFLAGSMSDEPCARWPPWWRCSSPAPCHWQPWKNRPPLCTPRPRGLAGRLTGSRHLPQILVTSHNADLLDSPQVKPPTCSRSLRRTATRASAAGHGWSRSPRPSPSHPGELLRLDRHAPTRDLHPQMRLFDEGGCRR